MKKYQILFILIAFPLIAMAQKDTVQIDTVQFYNQKYVLEIGQKYGDWYYEGGLYTDSTITFSKFLENAGLLYAVFQNGRIYRVGSSMKNGDGRFIERKITEKWKIRAVDSQLLIALEKSKKK